MRRMLPAEQAADTVTIIPLAAHEMKAATRIVGATPRRPRQRLVIFDEAFVVATLDALYGLNRSPLVTHCPAPAGCAYLVIQAVKTTGSEVMGQTPWGV